MQAAVISGAVYISSMMIYVVFLLVGFLMLGSAQDLPCAVGHGAGWTTYSVPEFNAASCHYSWANRTVS